MLTNKSVRISTSWLSCLFPIKWAGLGCDHMPVLLTAWPLLCLTGALVNFAFCNNNNCKHVTRQDLRLQVSFSKRWSCQVVGLFKSHSMQSESYHQLVGSADDDERRFGHDYQFISRLFFQNHRVAEIWRTLMCQHTNISTSSITGSVAHRRGKLTPKACCGLLAGVVALSCGQVEAWED